MNSQQFAALLADTICKKTTRQRKLVRVTVLIDG